MKTSTSTVALGLLLSLAVPAGAALAADPGEQILLQRAAFWRTQQRLDMVTETLNKILALNPSQPDALYQLGMLAMQRGDTGGAQPYFDRLRQMAATDTRAAELVQALSPTASRAPAPAKPVVAAAARPAPPVPPQPAAPARRLPVLAAVSADSDDLIASPPAHAMASAQTMPRPAAGDTGGQAARNIQLAAVADGTVSDAAPGIPAAPAATRQAGSADLGITVPPVQVAQLELTPPLPVDGYTHGITTTAYSPTDTLEIDIDRNLAQLEAQANPTLVAGLGFRWHDGTSGLSQLTEFGTPIEGTFSPWYTGTAKIDVLPVLLDSGSVASGNLSQFGANPILAATGQALVSPGQQSAGGVGILGGYSYGDFSGQFGTSPLGFPVTNLVGMAAVSPKFFDNTLTVRFEAVRQPVTDSVLSYAGTHASLAAANATTGGAFSTNATWGGVVRTGGNVSAFYDDNTYGAYGSIGLATLTGENVVTNSQITGLAGIYFRPYKTDNDAIRIGISAYYTGFDKNLSGFTFGQGGYFSPQNLEALTFPVEYTGHSGAWSYLASVAIGVQHFNQDGGAIFPYNLPAQVALANSGSPAFFAGSEGTGPAFNLRGQVEYAIDNTLSIGAAAGFDNSNNYKEVIAKLYVRKTFDWLTPNANGSDPAALARRDQPMSHL
jgi:hypothetical protein